MPTWLEAGLWGLLAGSALVIGALIGYLGSVPKRVVAAVMAFGSGVLISALAFELMDEALARGGLRAAALGCLAGAVVYTIANALLARYGAKHRKRSVGMQPTEEEDAGSGLAIAVGALLDGIPESLVVGLGLLAGGAVSWVTVAAFFLSNLPEGLSSASGMKAAGRSARYVFTVWTTIALASGVAAVLGCVLFDGASVEAVAATTAVAAGGILAMLVDTMIPEAYASAHEYSGLITTLGFLVAFALSKLGG